MPHSVLELSAQCMTLQPRQLSCEASQQMRLFPRDFPGPICVYPLLSDSLPAATLLTHSVFPSRCPAFTLAHFLTQDGPLASVSAKLLLWNPYRPGLPHPQKSSFQTHLSSSGFCTRMLSLYMQASVSEHGSQCWALERELPHTHVLQASKVKPRMLLREKITQGKRSEGGRKELLGEGPRLPGADAGEAAGRPVTQTPIAAHN